MKHIIIPILCYCFILHPWSECVRNKDDLTIHRKVDLFKWSPTGWTSKAWEWGRVVVLLLLWDSCGINTLPPPPPPSSSTFPLTVGATVPVWASGLTSLTHKFCHLKIKYNWMCRWCGNDCIDCMVHMQGCPWFYQLRMSLFCWELGYWLQQLTKEKRC